ncbi:MAG: arginine--tRNA ligase [Microthrixaceae bacterium]|nr:arginine--tRNA ligase [Microthrixaceae bacterium]
MELDGAPSDPSEVHLERPANPDHGEFSTNVALALAKRNGRNPRELAESLVGALSDAGLEHLESVETAGPGFVNFRLSPAWLHDVIGAVTGAGTDYGRSQTGEGTRVLVEFVSANPTGPVHAGHARGAAYGDALARLLAFCGYEVGREFYINDRGVQMEVFADSLAARPRRGATRRRLPGWLRLGLGCADARGRRARRVGVRVRVGPPAPGARRAQRHIRPLVLRT